MSIKKIKITETELSSKRVKQIKNIVKKIAANNSIHPTRVPSNFGENKIIFCVTDSSRITNYTQFNNESNINERFKTKNKLFTASYYEIWEKVTGTKQDYNLNRIYFHIYLSDSDKEYILLHTDPLDNDETHGMYKRSPHLHIKHSIDNIIPHAHFALNVNDYDIALSTIEEINKCFQNHIEMIAHQILFIRK
ncbi:hypothetical protein [Algoriphagus yeomjeoni]|uniref:Uncharacterized protein n=1 Tax=Algoriphagus yeomjeoni TaxID=291403 RepID=A0A327PLK5_9BACT|nr:hypothetical protein [Algoriphagus yeomjeoni]RAI92211.1 hypothetical protein LV83_01440 [Algoriphagus yeomjeoni]